MNSKKRAIISLLGISLGILLSCGVIIYREHKLEQAKIDAAKYEELEEYDNAIAEYNKIILEEINNPEWYLRLSEIYAAKGNKEKSDAYIEKLKELEDNEGYYTSRVIFMHFINGEEQLALEEGQVALEEYPENNKLKEIMILVYKSNNLDKKAEELIREYEVDRASASDLAEYAKMLLLIEEQEEAYELLKEAWNIDKDEFLIYDVIAQMAAYNKDKILKDIVALYKQDFKDPIYRMWLAKIYSISEGTANTALDLIGKLEEEGVESKELDFIKLLSYQSIGEEEIAEKLCREITSKYDDYSTYHTIAWYYYNKGDYEKSLELCEKSIKANEEYADNYGFLMPQILSKLGEEEKIDTYFNKALLIEPYNHNIMISFANYYYDMDNRKKAMDYFKVASKMKPHDTEIKYTVAFIDLKNQEYDKAIEILEECIELSKENPIGKYYRTLSTIYMLQGDGDKAYKYIKEAYSIDEEDVLTLNNAGVYHISMSSNEDMTYNIERAYTNLLKAFEGLNASYDEDVIETISNNFEMMKDLHYRYYNGEDNEILEIPEFILFY